MLIDKLMKVVDRMPDITSPPDAPLFRLDESTCDAISSVYFTDFTHLNTHWEPENWTIEPEDFQSFSLPFPRMQIELGARGRESAGKSCCLLEEDPKTGEYSFVLGVSLERNLSYPWGPDPHMRNFELLMVGGMFDILKDDDLKLGDAIRIKGGAASFEGVKSRDSQDIFHYPDRYNKDKPWDRVWPATDGNLYSFDELMNAPDSVEVEYEYTYKYLQYGMQNLFNQELIRTIIAVLWINRPSHFIVEETPTRWEKRPPKLKKVINSTKKPHFICLTPERIKSTYIKDPDSSPTGRKTRAHQRRGHWRTYSNERYRNLKGKRQWIDAIWVGPQESVVGKNKYIVRLDK